MHTAILGRGCVSNWPAPVPFYDHQETDVSGARDILCVVFVGLCFRLK